MRLISSMALLLSMFASAQQFSPKEKALMTKCNEMLESYKKNCSSKLADGGLEFKTCKQPESTGPDDLLPPNATVVVQFKAVVKGKIIPAHKECLRTTTIPKDGAVSPDSEFKWVQNVYSSLGTTSTFVREADGPERYAIEGADQKELLMTRTSGQEEWNYQYKGLKLRAPANDDDRDLYIAGKPVKFDVIIPPPTPKEFKFTETNTPVGE